MPKNMPRKPRQTDDEWRRQNRSDMMAKAKTRAAGEMPDVASHIQSMRPYTEGSWLTRTMFPRGAFAMTNPFGGNNIYYDPERLTDPQDMLDTAVHEGEHVRQMQGMSTGQKVLDILGGMFTPYDDRWQEREARQREQMAHQNRLRGDIKLPPSIGAIK